MPSAGKKKPSEKSARRSTASTATGSATGKISLKEFRRIEAEIAAQMDRAVADPPSYTQFLAWDDENVTTVRALLRDCAVKALSSLSTANETSGGRAFDRSRMTQDTAL